MRRSLAVFAAAATLAGTAALVAAAPVGADGDVSPAYTCTVELEGIDPINTQLPFTVEDDRDPVGVGGEVTYTFDLVLPALNPPIAVDLNTLTVTLPLPDDVTGAELALDFTGANPGAAFWDTDVTATEATVTYTGSGFNKIKVPTAGVPVFPLLSTNPVVLPEVSLSLTPTLPLELGAIDLVTPRIDGVVSVLNTPYGLECDPDNPAEIVATTGVCGAQSFSDVPPSNTFFCDIDWMNREEITTGFPGGIFKPNDAVKRQSMSAFMYRLAGSPLFPDPVTPTFADVAPSSTFYTEIEWMADEGITTGTNGLFKPNDTVKRAAMSAFMYRFVGEPAFDAPITPSFSDVGGGHPFYAEIEWMADEGITTGFPGGLFKPNQAVTRQSMSAFMFRLNDAFG